MLAHRPRPAVEPRGDPRCPRSRPCRAGPGRRHPPGARGDRPRGRPRELRRHGPRRARPSWRAAARGWAGRRAIRMTLHPTVATEVWLTVAYGVPVAEVARQVDSAVRYAARARARRDVGPVTIHVRRPAGTGAAARRTRRRRCRGPPAEATRVDRSPCRSRTAGAGDPGPAPRLDRVRSAPRRGLPSVVRLACDGAGLLEAVRAAVANLERHVDEINALNVFPVPDGDTGLQHAGDLHRDAALRPRRAASDGVADQLREARCWARAATPASSSSQVVRGLAEGFAGQAPLQRPRPRPRPRRRPARPRTARSRGRSRARC